MKNSFRYIIFIALFYCSDGYGQEDSTKVNLLIKILDAENRQPIYNAQSISYKNMLSFATDTDGILNYAFDIDDSIKVFGLGYEPQTLHVKDFMGIDSMINISLTRKTYMIKAVDVSSRELNLHLPNDIKLGKPDDLPEAPLRSDNFGTKPNVIDAVATPLSVVHYYTSKSEKEKREFRKVLNEQDNIDKVSSIYNGDIIKEVSEYEGDTLNHFIIYCNTHLDIKPETNPLIVMQMILDLKPAFEEKLKSHE